MEYSAILAISTVVPITLLALAQSQSFQRDVVSKLVHNIYQMVASVPQELTRCYQLAQVDPPMTQGEFSWPLQKKHTLCVVELPTAYSLKEVNHLDDNTNQWSPLFIGLCFCIILSNCLDCSSNEGRLREGGGVTHAGTLNTNYY